MAEQPSAEDWERFGEIVRKGGTVHCAQNVFEALCRWANETATSLLGLDIRVHPWMEPGTILAMAKPSDVPGPLLTKHNFDDLALASGPLWCPPTLSESASAMYDKALDKVTQECMLDGLSFLAPEDALRRSTYERPSDDELRNRIRREFGV